MNGEQLAARLDDITKRLDRIERPLSDMQVDIGVLKERTKHLEKTDDELKAEARQAGGARGGFWGTLGGLVGGFLAGLLS